MGIAIGVLVLHVLLSVSIYLSVFSNKAKNNMFFLGLARMFGHSVAAEPMKGLG